MDGFEEKALCLRHANLTPFFLDELETSYLRFKRLFSQGGDRISSSNAKLSLSSGRKWEDQEQQEAQARPEREIRIGVLGIETSNLNRNRHNLIASNQSSIINSLNTKKGRVSGQSRRYWLDGAQSA